MNFFSKLKEKTASTFKKIGKSVSKQTKKLKPGLKSAQKGVSKIKNIALPSKTNFIDMYKSTKKGFSKILKGSKGSKNLIIPVHDRILSMESP
jgi:hypothetical protein